MTDPWDAEMASLARLVRMALCEAGYPEAEVHDIGSGLVVEGAPDDVVDRAFSLVNDYVSGAP